MLPDRSTHRTVARNRGAGVLTINAEEKLAFDEMIGQISDDARFILSTDIRHGIMRVAPQILHEDPED